MAAFHHEQVVRVESAATSRPEHADFGLSQGLQRMALFAPPPPAERSGRRAQDWVASSACAPLGLAKAKGSRRSRNRCARCLAASCSCGLGAPPLIMAA